jgi:plastocyanin
MAATASASVSIKLTPIQPGTCTNTVTVTASGSSYSSSASKSITVHAATSTSYITVRDTGFSPTSLLAAPGQSVQFDFYGPGQHSAKDGSPLALFDSGVVSPVNYFAFRYTAGGTYPVLDANSSHTASVGIKDGLSAATVAHGTAVTVTMASASPASGFVLDLQVLVPGSSTWATVANGTTSPTARYTPATAGTYQLRSRLRNNSTGAATGYSPAVTLTAG